LFLEVGVGLAKLPSTFWNWRPIISI